MGKEVRLAMRTRIIAVLALAMMLALTFSAPAFATHQGPDLGGPPDPFAHPFCGSGADYAEEHIVVLAQGQQIMAPEGGGVHNPGLAHEGFAVCDPTDNDPFE
jgi:hypothetical protein